MYHCVKFCNCTVIESVFSPLPAETKTRRKGIEVWTTRRKRAEMKTTRKTHQGIKAVRKNQLAVLKPLKCRYCPWRFFSNTPRFVSHTQKHVSRFKSYWYKNTVLDSSQAAPKLKDHSVEKTYKCHFCFRDLTTQTGKTFHEKYGHICDSCGQIVEHHGDFREKNCQEAEVKKLNKLEYHGTEENNRCHFCSRYFVTPQGKTYRKNLCDSCSKIFEYAQVKKFDQPESRGIKEKYSKCLYCYKYIANHKKGAHSCGFKFNRYMYKLIYFCQFCDTAFRSKNEKEAHEKSTHTCDICKKTFVDALIRKKHEKECLHRQKQKYSCRFCGNYFSTTYAKAVHEISEHKCDLCDKTFENAEIKKLHKLEDHKGNKEETNKCRFCGKCFASAYVKTTHEIYSCCKKPKAGNANSKKSEQNQDAYVIHDITMFTNTGDVYIHVTQNGKCHVCSRDLTPAHYPLNDGNVLKCHVCLFCKKIFSRLPSEEKGSYEPAHNVHDQQSSESAN